MGRQADFVVARVHGHQLRADRRRIVERRGHDPEVGPVRAHLDHRAHGLLDGARGELRQRAFHGRDQIAHRQHRAHVGLGQQQGIAHNPSGTAHYRIVATPSAPGTFRTIDAHTAGEPLRLITDGWPAPRGATMLEKRAWARQHQDQLRRALMFEPRGHLDMYGALLTEPERPDSHAGVLFMHNEGFSTMCGHGIIAVVTIALERELIAPGGDGLSLVLDAPAGQIRARAELTTVNGRRRVSRVSFVNVPSFVFASAVPVRLGARTVPVDVAFGGAFYAIVDAEAAGVPVLPERLTELRGIGMAIKRAVEAAVDGRAPDGARAHRHLRHDLHGAADGGWRGPAERHDLR